METETDHRVLGQTTEGQNLKTISQIPGYSVLIKIVLLMGFPSLHVYKYQAAYLTLTSNP